ncbi:MAG TPA: porin [Polyangiaceae bacterium]
MTHPRLRLGGPALAAALLLSGTAAGQTAAPSAPATPSAQGPDVAPPPTAADVAELRDEVRTLRTDLDATRQEKSPEWLPHPGPKPLGYELFWPWVVPPEGLSVRGYLQSQYESHQDSQDQLTQNGALLNKDRFSIRRARVNLNGEWEYAAVSLELDANTTNGPQVDLRKAEASLQYRPDRRKPPIVMATAGLFDTPFGYELVESPSTRFFMERSQASLAFFPAEPDVGLRLAGALGFFRWTIATTNGNPMGVSTFQLQDPIKAKDVLFRFGFDAQPLRDLQVAADVSSLRGMGFHPGTAATSASIQWNDLNEDGLVQPYEIVGVPGASATPSQNFPHWAFGADARVSFRTALGVTKVYGEFVLAQNLDRGLYVADPIVTNVDQREMGYYAGIVQEVTRWAVVGLRFDVYDPNLDASDSRGGKLLPFSEAITTWSPMVGLVLPDRARLVLQYDAIDNAFARSAVGVPTKLQDDVFTCRLQVQL